MKYLDSYFIDLDNSWNTIPGAQTLSGKRILIAGATGLIGSSIADLLLRRNAVNHSDIRVILAGRSPERVRERFPVYSFGEDYQFLEFDSTRAAGIDIGTDYIIHAASNADPASYVNAPVDIIRANVNGVQVMLETALRNRSRVLFISSSEVYGINAKAPYREDAYGSVNPLSVRSCYPSSKRCAESLCVAYGKQYGVDSVIVRPGHIYGPMFTATDSKASAQFARCARAGHDIVMKSAGSQRRSYCYALDCATAILTVLLRGKSGEAYNVSNPDSLATVSDLAHAFAELSGKKVVFENPSDAEAAGYNPMNDSSLDSGKLEALGWKGLYPLREGVERTLKYM